MANPVPQPASWVSAPPGISPYGEDNFQVIFWGASSNISFNASGGAATLGGPYQSSVIRIACGAARNVRLAIGDSGVTAGAGSTLFVGPGVEFIGITPGQYVSAISDDASAGSINITIAA